MQERLTAQVADCICEHLQPKGVAVVIEASHACMTARGVNTPGVMMTTSRMMGIVPRGRAQPPRSARADGLLTGIYFPLNNSTVPASDVLAHLSITTGPPKGAGPSTGYPPHE